MLQQAAPWNGPRDKLVTIRGWLAIWFSQRTWRQYGGEGEICRQSLFNDILVVAAYWERKTAPAQAHAAHLGQSHRAMRSHYYLHFFAALDALLVFSICGEPSRAAASSRDELAP